MVSKSNSSQVSSFTGNIYDTEYVKRELILANAELKEILISPNPVSELFQVNFDLEEDGPIDLELFSLSGKMIYSNSFYGTEGINTIDIRTDQVGLDRSGLYIVKLGTSSHTFVSKIIKE